MRLQTEKGTGVCQKIDIFKERLWYAYDGDWMQWYELSAEQVREIMSINKKGKKVSSLEDYKVEVNLSTFEFNDGAGQDSLTRFDQPKKRRKKRRNKSRNQKRKPQQQAKSKQK